MLVRVGSNDKEVSAWNDIFAQIGNEFISFKINAGQLAALGHIVLTGAGSQEENHRVAPFQAVFIYCSPSPGDCQGKSFAV